MGCAPASFATRVRTRAASIAHKPSTLSFEAAATIPIVFLTAYYALIELAHLRAGERVLIHGAAGGVGIAAIQIARYLGAEVFATAGSAEKREFVRLIGADHVFDSRSLAFATQIRKVTAGKGMDVVLNSLAGEAMVFSIDLLRPFGRFLELGKRDFYEDSQLGLRPFRNNISYFGVDADQLMGEHPQLTKRIFREIMDLFEKGVLYPLPYRAFPASEAKNAFRTMQQSRQIGKVLVTYPLGAPLAAKAVQKPLPTFDPAGAYLIVGGTGGLGFATAKWMIKRGARHITLTSRSGRLNKEQQSQVKSWRENFGTELQVQARVCDVTDAQALASLVQTIEKSGYPIKGVVHSAMQIEDGLLRNLDQTRFMAALSSKVAGAWNLHRIMGDRALDCFILYSSVTTYLGSPGQGNYVAANAFLEALTAMRRAQGLPATFMAWGPIEDVGFLARNQNTRSAAQSRLGSNSITSTEAVTALGDALTDGLDGLAGEAVVRLDWRTVGRMPAAKAGRFADIMASSAQDEAENVGSAELRVQILALPPEQAYKRVVQAIRVQIARILQLPLDRIELDKPVIEMGMDSLMGMELGLAVEENFQVKLSMMTISEGASAQVIANRIVAAIMHEHQHQNDAPSSSVDEQQQSPVTPEAVYALD
jgi:NADPH:quinone reductase-like Zn-dependent oxidoreductase/acyl carrier protein